MLQELRFAVRLFNRHRGYAAIAALTMALGVGANTAISRAATWVPAARAGRVDPIVALRAE